MWGTTVLGSALTGLLFTRSQEETQPGGLTRPGQTEKSIPYHLLSCWVPVGGEQGGGNSLAAREHAASVLSRRAAVWVVGFVLCFPLICIVIVTVPLVCCSVKLPSSRPTSFCLFLSILLHTSAEGGASMWRFCCWPQTNHNNH